jgi:hypothetical protein
VSPRGANAWELRIGAQPHAPTRQDREEASRSESNVIRALAATKRILAVL